MTDMTKSKNHNRTHTHAHAQTGKTADPAEKLAAQAPVESSADVDAALDGALEETFPASDPMSSLRTE